MKSQFCSNSGNSDINFVNTYSNNGACGVRIFVVCWSSRKRICRRSKMADSHSEGVRRWHIRTEHYNKLGARGGESIQRSSNKMPLSFRTTKLDSKIGSHRIDPGGEEAEGGACGHERLGNREVYKPETVHRNRVAWLVAVNRRAAVSRFIL